MKNRQNDYSHLPSVEQVLQADETVRLISEFGRNLVVDAIREELAEKRRLIAANKQDNAGESLLVGIHQRLEKQVQATLQPVINATGVILHTNLGRAPMSEEAREAVRAVASEYNTLEFDLENGKRGSRITHVEKLITRATGAEAAFVVCNNAAAVLLCLSMLARRKNVVISRTQMVEIGDGFRIPDILRQSGARLLEIGTTNKVHLEDYRQAIEGNTAVVLRVHHSNFKLTGFTGEPDLEDLVNITHEKGAVLIDNLGSGALFDTARFGIAHEPTVQESLQAGADLVCFSGDKLVGGPQAGIIVGRKDLIQKLRKYPLARAVRADKMCLAALAATFRHYVLGEAEKRIPIWMMAATPPEALKARAMRWAEKVGRGQVIEGRSTIGGGSLPEETMPTWLFSLTEKRPDSFQACLRKMNPPVIGRIENDRVLFDPRTVFPQQDDALAAALTHCLKTFHNGMDT